MSNPLRQWEAIDLLIIRYINVILQFEIRENSPFKMFSSYQCIPMYLRVQMSIKCLKSKIRLYAQNYYRPNSQHNREKLLVIYIYIFTYYFDFNMNKGTSSF